MAFSSLSTGATALNAFSDNMQVISNNLSNVNTVGFKSSRTLFGDLMSTEITGANYYMSSETTYPSQVGNGVGISAIETQYTQGSILSAADVTDLAISGKGYFGVYDSLSNAMYYTRAGDMHFDADGNLVNSSGLHLMGRQIDPITGEESGAITQIHLDLTETTDSTGATVMAAMCQPKATSSISMITNLDSDEEDKSTDEDNPFFALFNNYNGTSDTPLSEDDYSYSSNLTVYDENGDSYDVTVYYDKVDVDDGSGNIYYEYVVATDPANDGRAAAQGTSSAGLLQMGILTFDAKGQLVNQAAYSLGEGADAKDLSSWSTSPLSSGVSSFTASFTTDGSSPAAQTISLDFGIGSATNSYSATGTAADVGSNADNIPALQMKYLEASPTTAHSTSSYTQTQSQDGYTLGYLSTFEVDDNGVISGRYTNGVTQELYQVALYSFRNESGLERVAGTMFLATNESGEAIVGTANDSLADGSSSGDMGFGSIASTSLESSNVDLAEEFASMILNQQALQANTKVVTTSNEMYQTALGVKT